MSSFVQANAGADANSSSFNLAYSSNVTAGNFLVAVIATWDATARSVSSITDTLGNTWTRAIKSANGGGNTTTSEIWYALTSSGGANTVSFTLSAAAGHHVVIAEYVPDDTGVTVAASGANDNSFTTSHTSGATSDSAATGDLVIGGYADVETTPTASAGSGYTIPTGGNGSPGAQTSVALEHKLSATAGTQTATFTTSAGATSAVTVAAFHFGPPPPPPTRFYVDSGGTAPLASLSYASLWDRTTDAVRRPMNTSKQNSALVTTAKQCGSVSANWDVCHYQFQSGSLPDAGTLSGTFKAWFQGIESATGANAYPQVTVRVVNGDGSIVRGTAYSGGVQTAASATVEFDNTATYQAQRFPDSRDSNTLTDVDYQAGDHIIVEIGIRHLTAGGTTQTATIRAGDVTANSDLPETQNGSTTANPWIEFSQELFPASVSKSGSDTGAVADIAIPGLILTEAPTVVEASSLIALTVSESATAVDNGQSSGGKAGSDTGTVTDIVTRIGLSPGETSAGVDTATSVGALATSQSQSGTAVDTASQIGLSSSEVGASADAATRINLTGADTATVVDNGTVQVVGATVNKSSGDTAAGVDSVSRIGRTVTEIGTTSDTLGIINATFSVGTSGVIRRGLVGTFVVGEPAATDAGTTVDAVNPPRLIVSEIAAGGEDAAVLDLGSSTPTVSDTATVSDQAFVTIVVAESASAIEAIDHLSLNVIESAAIAESRQVGLFASQSAIGTDVISGLSQGTSPSVTEVASVIDFARLNLLVSETGTISENRSIPIWGPETDAVVISPELLTTAVPANGGQTNLTLVTAGHTSVTVVGNIPTTTQVVPLLLTQVILSNNGVTMLRAFRPGTVGVEVELELSETALKLMRREDLREKALAMRESNGNGKPKRVVSGGHWSALRGRGSSVKGPKDK